MQQIINYLKATSAEMKHVKWPTQTQTVIYTALIIVICIVTGLFLAGFDYIFSQAIDAVVNQF